MTNGAGAPSDAPCVLIVDDDEDIRESMREVVEMGGCSALLAANGAEALDLLRLRRPCLTFLDLHMPVMSGEELIAAVRQNSSLAGLPIVVSTSDPTRAPPGVPVLPKPVDLAAVWGWMRKACRCGASAPRGTRTP